MIDVSPLHTISLMVAEVFCLCISGSHTNQLAVMLCIAIVSHHVRCILSLNDKIFEIWKINLKNLEKLKCSISFSKRFHF